MEITSAKEVRQQMETDEYKHELNQAVERLMKRIKNAANKGEHHTCFVVPIKYEDDVKTMLIKEGYTFQPTGYVGGVWQLSEDICW